jgi:hypothetical protein
MCFFNSAEQDYLEQNEPFFTLKTMISRKYSFQTLTQFYTETMCWMLQILTSMLFIGEIHVFL